jgi:phosphoribosylformylglycinamidine cyclo-ligase
MKAVAHITGGGFTENIPRVLPDHLGISLDLSAIPVHGVFRWLASAGPIAEEEMLRTFNCGIGMIAVVAREHAQTVRAALEAQGERVSCIGEVIAAPPSGRIVYSGQLAL